MSRKTNAPQPRPVGRPKSRPAGAVFWGVWVTPAEKGALKTRLAELRAQHNSPDKSPAH